VVGRVIGRGSFGQVIVAYDVLTDTRVALKVIKRSERFDRQAVKEVDVLRVLGGGGGGGGRGPEEGEEEARGKGAEGGEGRAGHPNVVTLLDSFIHQGSMAPDGDKGGDQRGGRGRSGANDPNGGVSTSRSSGSFLHGYRCLVFELLSHSLYDVLQSTAFRGVSLGLTRKFTRQILSALSYLKSLGVVHCDLKPENVLLCSTDRSAVKLIDFGSSCWSGEREFTYVQSRFYRAAEVIMGLPYGCPVDMWSLGCIVVELHSGKLLFPGRDEREQLRKIAEALGEVPRWMVERCPPDKVAAHFQAATNAPAPRRQQGVGAGVDGGGASPSTAEEQHIPGSKPLRTTIVAAARTFQSQRGKGLGMEEEEEEEGVEEEAAEMDSASAAAAAATLSLRELGLRDRDTGDESPTTSARARTSSLNNLTEVALFCDFVERLLTYSPDDRLAPEDALAHPFFGPIPRLPPPVTAAAAAATTHLNGDIGDVDTEMLLCWDGMRVPQDTVRGTHGSALQYQYP
jgi:dual specificity tyrosine-phosphorylation-regulated kinase 1